MPEADSKNHRKMSRFKIIGLLFLGLVILLGIGLYLVYVAFTAPVIPLEEMERAFAECRASMQSASPERIKLGEEYVALLAELPQRPEGDWWINWDSQEYRRGARKWLEASSAYLEEFHALAAKGPGAIELDFDAGAALSFPGAANAREPARLLRIVMMEAAEAGDGARVLAAAKAIDCTAQTLEYRGLLSPHMVARSCRSIMVGELIKRRTSLDDAASKELIAWLERAEESLPEPAKAFMAQMILAEWMYRNGFSSFFFRVDKPESLSGRQGFFRRLSVKQVSILVRIQQDMVEAAKRPPSDAISEFKRIEEDIQAAVRRSRLKRLEYAMAKGAVPGGKLCYCLMIAQVAKYRGTRIVLALELYRRKHKAYPEDLSALVPEFIESLPADPFSNEAFKYLREGDEYRLYSVGANLQDDGGRMVDYIDENGDWVIFPERPY